MGLSAGTRLGPYEIQSALGAGGMGEVYKARDTRLERIVAIKVLPSRFAADPQFRERFDREARVRRGGAPSPGFGEPGQSESGGRGPHASNESLDFLVLEYLEGEALARRLENGPLPLDSGLVQNLRERRVAVAADAP